MQSGKSWMKIKHKKHNAPEGDEAKNTPASPDSANAEAAAAASAPAEAPPPPDSAPVPPVPDAAPEEKKLDDRYLRLLADFENFRKRTLRERNDVYRVANEEFIQELLPVLDHFELALEAARRAGAAPAILDGFNMVSEQWMTVMKKFGVEPIEAEGQVFDPTRHEAISHLASDTVPDHAVIQQTRRGYRLGDKLLRAAQVVVSSGPALPPDPPPAKAPEPKKEE
jgi:molecular chaperone GrpE